MGLRNGKEILRKGSSDPQGEAGEENNVKTDLWMPSVL